MSKKFTIPVRFEGTINYTFEADTIEEAREKADDLAADENDFNKLTDIEWEVRGGWEE